MNGLLDHYIETPNAPAFPHIAGHNTTIASIVQRHRNWNMPLSAIAIADEIPIAAAYAAMAFYYSNPSQIDPQIIQLESQPQQSLENLQHTCQGMLTEVGYDTKEKVMALIHEVKLEILAEKEIQMQ